MAVEMSCTHDKQNHVQAFFGLSFFKMSWTEADRNYWKIGMNKCRHI